MTITDLRVRRTAARGGSALPRVRRRHRRPRLARRRDHLLRTGHLLTVSSMATSGIGLLYWMLAARAYGPAAVGVSYAAVSAMTLAAGIGQLDLGNVLVRFVPGAGARSRRMVGAAYGAAMLATLAAATAFVLAVPAISPRLTFLHAPAIGAAFVLGAIAYSVFALQDGVLTGLRRPGWILAENLGFALVKIGLVAALAASALRAQGILLSWVAALLAAVVITNALLLSRLPKRRGAADGSCSASADTAGPAPAMRYIASDYTGELCWMATMGLPPIIVLDRLGAVPAAYYSLAWLIAHALYMVSINMGLSLVVETAREPGRADRLRHMLRHTGLVVAGCVAAVVAAAPLILRIFGGRYAADGAGLLRLLALSALPNLVVVTAVSVARSKQRMGLVVAVYGSICGLVLGLSFALMPRMGVTGVGVAWLTAQCVVAGALLCRRDLWRAGCGAAIAAPPQEAGTAEPRVAAAPPTPTVCVIVCAYTLDRWDDICAAVDSLRRQRHPADEVILVIDHCEPLAERARREFDGLRVVENSERRGLSGARNTGVRTAHSDVVAFLDDDAVAQPQWIEQLLAPYADADILGVGGLVRPAWARSRPSWFPHEFDWVVGCSYRGMPSSTAGVRNFIGANMSFRRDVLTRLGGFRHELGRVGTRPLGGEETELCIRALREHQGGRLIYTPAAVVDHHVPAGRGTWTYFRARCYAEGLSKSVVRKHAGATAALESERAYLRSTLPSALLRPLRRGPGRAPAMTVLALLVGTAWTVAGYCAGRINPLLLLARPQRQAPQRAQEPRASRIDRAARAVGWAALPVALALWVYSLPRIRLSRLSDLGLITAVPVTFWCALGVLTAGFTATIAGRARISAVVPAGYVLGLIAVLHATAPIVYPTLRYAWAWKHVAIVDLLAAQGGVPNIPGGTPMAAYSQWPGFFALNAFLVRMTGVESAGSFAAWGPPLFNALMLVPLVLLYRSITTRRRLVWTGVWVFYACSWIGQDYFAPQAYVFVLYLVFLAVVVRRITAAAPGSPLPRGELALLLLIAAAIDSSHQLTPIMLVTAVGALALRRVRRRALLPLLAGVAGLAVLWDATVARPFIAANLHSLIQALGNLDSNVGSGMIALGSVPRDQVLIAWIDRGLTSFVLLLAAAALVRRPTLRRSPLSWLALCPLGMVGVSNYGGEMIFRVYLFALPAAALLAAALLLPPDARARIRVRSRAATSLRAAARTTILAGTFAAMLGGLVFGYYGKEAANVFTSNEVEAAQFLSGHANPGELILAPNDNFPGAYTDYPLHPRVWFAEQNPGIAQLVLADPVGELLTLSAGSPDLTAYVILSRSQAVAAAQSGSLPAGAFAAIKSSLEYSDTATAVYSNADAVVFRLSLLPTSTAAAPDGSGR